jgi:type IV secretion system protein VirB10
VSRSGAAADGAGAAIEGERGWACVYRARSIQSRLSGVLAAALMLSVGLGMLGWYYGSAAVRGDRIRDTARKSAAARAQAEMPLPALGRIDPPATVVPAGPPAHSGEPPAVARPQAPVDGPRGDWPRRATRLAGVGVESTVPLGETNLGAEPRGLTDRAPVVQALAPSARERRLAGHLFGRSADGPGAATSGGGPVTTNDVALGSPALPPAAVAASAPWADAAAAGVPPTPMAAAGTGAPSRGLGTVTAIAEARVLPTRRFLLPKGAFIDCTLETAVDSTLPGLTTCITATDTFGADGQVVLLERGTKLIGETRGQVQQGAARVYVMWTEARTPTGVAVPLDSPGTDELGRAGLPGAVNRHFWERFGAAILISMIDGGVQAAVQSGSRGGGAVLYSPNTSHEVMTEVLKSTVNIPPTVVKPQGACVQALVARDVDFRAVYELRVVSADR